MASREHANIHVVRRVFSPASHTATVIKDNKPLLESSYCISTANQNSQHTQKPQHSSTQQRSAQLTFSILSLRRIFGFLYYMERRFTRLRNRQYRQLRRLCCESTSLCFSFTTGNPFLGTKLLGFSMGRGSGALNGLILRPRLSASCCVIYCCSPDKFPVNPQRERRLRNNLVEIFPQTHHLAFPLSRCLCVRCWGSNCSTTAAPPPPPSCSYEHIKGLR